MPTCCRTHGTTLTFNDSVGTDGPDSVMGCVAMHIELCVCIGVCVHMGVCAWVCVHIFWGWSGCIWVCVRMGVCVRMVVVYMHKEL